MRPINLCINLIFATTAGLAAANSSDPFSSNFCSGGALKPQDAITMMAPGTTSVTFGKYRVLGRSRTCNSFTGCKQWIVDTDVSSVGAQGRDVIAKISNNNGEIDLIYNSAGTESVPWCSHHVSESPNLSMTCGFSKILRQPETYTYWPGLITNTCAYMYGKRNIPLQTDPGSYVETEVVFVQTHGRDTVIPVSEVNLNKIIRIPLSCLHTNWGHQYTCSGVTKTERPFTTYSEIKLAKVNGVYSATMTDENPSGWVDFEGSYTFDRQGLGSRLGTGSGTASVNIFGKSIALDFSFYADYGHDHNCGAYGPSSGNSVTCSGLFVAP